MKKVNKLINLLMFGTGQSSIFLENMLNNKTQILAYIDNDETKRGKHRNNIEIIEPKSIGQYNYDYILIGSQFNEEIYQQLLSLGVDKNKIFQFYNFTDVQENYFEKALNDFKENLKHIEVINTGISYTSAAIRQDILCKRICKFAFASQDLFYDYHIVKYILTNFEDKLRNLKYCIIGLSYYSFQYDMSLSSMKNKVILYYEILKQSHHFHNINKIYEEYKVGKKIADKILNKKEDQSYNIFWKSPDIKSCNDKDFIGKKQAETDCNKNYPSTVRENTLIFKDYLKLLKDHNVKPIVVVIPASRYYTKYFSKRIEDEFHSIIKDVKKEYDFQYIDYFRSDLFNDEDFWDISHLDTKGAEKFTEILNKEIKW